ncbi:hypothetical protein GCM10023189_36900 [Nibrella saemangeumensis]|uniref:Natural product n=1 Tax=Nibrella saemangeumensis TaxID=1084526 RepID=A0ABP8N4X7_9BACT
MKKLLMDFATNLLSKQQMKEIKGGGSYRCHCFDPNQNPVECITADYKYNVMCPCYMGDQGYVDNC